MRALVLLLLAAAPAQADCRLQSCVFPVAGSTAFSVVGMHGMKGKRWVVEATGGVWSMRTGAAGNEVDIKPGGTSAAFAVKYEFSPRWGIGFFAAQSDMSGKESFTEASGLAPDNQATFDSHPNGAGFPGGTVKDMAGNLGGIFLTRDFRPVEDGVRVPFSFGLMAVGQRFEFVHEFTNPNNGQPQRETLEIHEKGPGFFVNVSVDVPVRSKWVVMPGAFLAHGASSFESAVYTVTQGATTTTYPSGITATNVAPVLYTTFLYKPWNLALDWNMTELLLPLEDVAGITSYSLKWTKKWG